MEAKQPTEEPTPTKEGGASKDGTLRPRPSTSTLLVMLVVFVVGALLVFSSQQPKYSEIDYSFFHQQLEAGNIAEIQMSGQTVRGRFKVPPIDPKAVAAAAKKLQEDAKKKFDEAKAKKDKPADDKASDETKQVQAKPAEAKSAEPADAKKAEPSDGKNAKKDASKEIKRLYPEFSVYLPPLVGEDLEKLLLEKGVTIRAEPPTDNANMLMLVWLLVTVLLFAGVWTMMRRTRDQFMGGGIFSGFAKSPAKRYDTSKSRVTFKDVAGLEGVKLDLQEIVEFLKNPEKFQRLGGRIPKGVLLMGPPGTGKTLLARAVAGEAGVPFFSISGSEFIQMFVGVGASRVRDLFKTAKENAPAILFIDEIDAVGRQRGAGLGGGHDEREQTLNQILSEMDGFSQTESVIVLAATNRPDVLDPALLRPGRFDRHVTVDRPNHKGRVQLFEVHTHDVPLADDVNIDRLAAGTIGLTGADIRNLVNEAALWATRNGKEKVDMSDFEYARDKILMGPKREEVLVGKEKTMTAYHESGHALLAWILPGADLVHKVTIIPRGRALGVTHLLPQEDRMNIGERDLHARLVFMLGGRAAEKLVFDEYSAGAENDLKEATRLARKMVAHWGMSERLGPVAYRTSEDHPFLGREIVQEHREFSEHTAQVIDEEVARMLHGAADRAQQLLSEHRANLDALSKALEDKEALDQSDIEKILGPCANVLPSLNGTPTAAEENGQPSRASTSEPTTAASNKSKSD